VKVNFYLNVGELTSRTLAKRLRTLSNRPKTLANETLAKQLVGETTGYRGKMYRGSGFKIPLPDVNRSAVVTSDHCTNVEGAYAKKITVTFPEQRAVVVESNDI